MMSNSNKNLQVFGLVQDSIVDGPGLRFVVFVQGCTHACPGCHNPESQPIEGGKTYTIDDIYDKIRANGLIHSVTLSGGEPFEQPEGCAALSTRLKADGYNVWVYTGYLYEDLLAKSGLSSGETSKESPTETSPKISDEIADEALQKAQLSNLQKVQPSNESLSTEETNAIGALLKSIDVLVDGPFVESLKSFDARWRGSTNQRLIDVPTSLAEGKVVLYE